MAENVYERLGEHLNRAHAGVPAAPERTEILKILYPGEEAEVALKMSIYEKKTLAQLEESMPERAGKLAGILDVMAHRGTVFTQQKTGSERVYRLLPSIVGFVEIPFLTGEDTETTRALAPLWKSYILSGMGEELARGVPLIRVIPIAESLEDKSGVLPSDALTELVNAASFIAVGHCPCRQIMKATGEGCDHPIERCMHFGSLGRHMVEIGNARQLTADEALAMLRSATEEGLVHVCDNVEGGLGTICNCCPCCCAFFRARQANGLETYSRSNFVASVDAEMCTGCATCEDRCPVGAISVVEEVAQVDADKCIGCGVCTPTCQGDGAILLSQRAEVKAPPTLPEFIGARLPK